MRGYLRSLPQDAGVHQIANLIAYLGYTLCIRRVIHANFVLKSTNELFSRIQNQSKKCAYTQDESLNVGFESISAVSFFFPFLCYIRGKCERNKLRGWEG